MDHERGSSIRRRWLAGMAIVAIASAAGMVWLLTRNDDDPGDPGRPPYVVLAGKDTPEFIRKKCGSCHPNSHPSMLSATDWPRVIEHMTKMSLEKFGVKITPEETREILKYYLAHCPDSVDRLPPDPVDSPLVFEPNPLPMPDSRLPDERPNIKNVNVVDLDGDGFPEVLVCDGTRRTVSVIHAGARGGITESPLAPVDVPGRTEVIDWNGDGSRDVVVPVLGIPKVTDDVVGKVILLTNNGKNSFSPRTILEGVGRVADARPGDFDGDGDVDFVVAVFGFIQRGQLGWLEQQEAGKFQFHTIEKIPGAIHAIPCNLNGDGALDFVALISQHHEKVVAYLNRGEGEFEPKVLWQAGTPLFGSSGIEMVDLDGDGDLDILMTNGDAFDLNPNTVDISALLRPWHGIHWLENHGNLRFTYHDLARFYGAYRALAGDLDADGDLDVVAVSIVNDWADPGRMSLIWLENDGQMNFTPHGISNGPTHLSTAALGDLDGDGRLDIVAGGMHLPIGTERIGRVTVWWNRGPRK